MRLVPPLFYKILCNQEDDITYLYIWSACFEKSGLRHHSSNGIGLAAPQIGKAIRLVVIDLDVLSDDLPEYKGFRHAFINAHILEYDDENKDSSDEGCLSIPGISEKVVRPTRIHVKYMDEDFQEHDEWVGGYLARVMQHEFDHLEGTMFVDRVSALRKNMISGKLKNIIKGKFRCSYRTKIRH